MKFIFVFFITMTCYVSAFGQYKISEDQFKLNCLDYVRQTYGICEDGQLIRMQDFKPLGITIIQNIESNLYLASMPGEDNIISIKILGKPHADGDKLCGRLLECSDLFSYKNVMGSKSTVKKYQFEEPPRSATNDEILSAFKNGQSFWVRIPNYVSCSRCDGRGTIPTKNGTFVIQSPCPECNGEKKVSETSIVKVVKK